GHMITYVNQNGLLTQISDSTGQVLTISYDAAGRIQSVAGPDRSATPMRRALYNYSANGLLVSVGYQLLQSNGTYTTARTVQYKYNSNRQLSAVIAPDGTTTFTTVDNLRGQSTQTTDPKGNTARSTYTLDPASGGSTTRVMLDTGTASGNSPT